MAAPIYYSADMVRAMPDDGNRYEVVYGELLVTPAPRLCHQLLIKRLSFALESYLRREPVGVVLTSPADISWGPDVLVQPDVFVAATEEARTLDAGSPGTLRGPRRPSSWNSESCFSRCSRGRRHSPLPSRALSMAGTADARGARRFRQQDRSSGGLP